jgi:hypothetical protein
MIVLAGVNSVDCHDWWCWWRDKYLGVYGEKVPARLLALQRTSHNIKEVIKSV